ncbi:HAD family hydrolase [Candidatus Saccharibacteria bacterium RIFCSPHIGHO2_01_FULL_45_15]|nr:MAG: HAD family hydrolase [Candidatus Saccharibacteria bacterium RIFCSPHIGHO2_01_FULL_45_15]OGL27983.1 MAG: HAD family hydrolase [Candidatus Saccharibacteria bacterium RIFCSPHIGHO2_02_FULL_46_12]OGL31710.1 MAG: HAD family hydrolase [Candidatus Saccharibacteria bacterium RIFCSPHIGHO2_12_FULL_44_22]
MPKRVIAFDLDDTLAITKSPISDRMGELLSGLLEHYDVCIISGGKFEQFKKQVVDRLEAPAHKLNRMHLMPTCGTRYYRYDELAKEWKIQYAEDLSADQKAEILKVVEQSAREVHLWAEKPYGEIIEDRGSQVTYSALGQQAPAEEKYAWAKDNEQEKQVLRQLIAERLPDLEVRLGGTTSVDITRIGIDKAYGMRKLIEALGISKDEILFLGDKLNEGGNDYPVKAMGIDSIAVERWEDTALVLEGILGVTE